MSTYSLQVFKMRTVNTKSFYYQQNHPIIFHSSGNRVFFYKSYSFGSYVRTHSYLALEGMKLSKGTGLSAWAPYSLHIRDM